MRVLMPLSAVVACLAALAACSPSGEAPAAEGETAEFSPSASASLPPAAAGPVTRDQVYAAAAEGPEPFVRALYALYVNGGPQGEQPAPGQDPIFSRMLNATIGADFRVANGEVPSLNYDLICACQDQGAFTLDSAVVGQSDANNATAAVVFTNAGQTTSQTLTLVREGPNWKVDDIIGPDGKSVKDETIKLIEAAGG
jgi:hypothetical protein